MFHGWRYKRFHISVLLAWFAVGLLGGLFVGKYTLVAGSVIPVVVLLFFVAGISLHSKRWYACMILVGVGFVLGMFRGATFLHDVQLLDVFSGKQVILTGSISQDPVLMNGSNTWQAQLSAVSVNKVSYDGEVYATVLSDETLKRGDVVTLSGKALSGFGSFRLSLYRAETVHIVRQNDPFLSARDTFASATRKVMPEPEASLGLGFLVGEKSALPSDLTEQLKTVGLTHIIVASGYNLTIFVRFARRIFARRSRYLALVGSLLLVAGYVLVSGFSPSMNRAAVVTFLTLLAWYYGRKFHPVKLILYVASASAFLYPSYLWTDLGWQLSFAAFTGVLVVAPIVTRLIYPKGTTPGALVQLIIETMSAEVMTLPLIIASFGYVPVLALFANVLVAPVIPFAMFFTFIAGVVGSIGSALSLVALPASIVVAFVLAVVENLASPDWARYALTLPVWVFVAWYLALVGVMFTLWKRRRVDLLETSVVE